MTAKTQANVLIDWQQICEQRQAGLHDFAALRGVSFRPDEAVKLVAVSLREDAERALAQAHAMVGTRPTRPVAYRGTITAIGVAELRYPDGRYLLLRRDREVWIVPDVPDGWLKRRPWFGDLNSIRWVGGPPAVAAFRRVGAPIS